MLSHCPTNEAVFLPLDICRLCTQVLYKLICECRAPRGVLLSTMKIIGKASNTVLMSCQQIYSFRRKNIFFRIILVAHPSSSRSPKVRMFRIRIYYNCIFNNSLFWPRDRLYAYAIVHIVHRYYSLT